MRKLVKKKQNKNPFDSIEFKDATIYDQDESFYDKSGEIDLKESID